MWPHAKCSLYLSLGPDKGKTKTKPVDEVAWLFEDQGQTKGIIVSTSDPIPSNDDSDQPPHRQTANYYKDVVADLDGQFKVTMENPKESDPKPLVIEITANGAELAGTKSESASASAKSIRTTSARTFRPVTKSASRRGHGRSHAGGS